jgi:hypothetical protein
MRAVPAHHDAHGAESDVRAGIGRTGRGQANQEHRIGWMSIRQYATGSAAAGDHVIAHELIIVHAIGQLG